MADEEPRERLRSGNLLWAQPANGRAINRTSGERSRYEAVNFQTKKNFEVVVSCWIDAKSSAIRRVVREMQLDELRSVGTLELEPEFDVELPVAALAFDPPEAKP
jgi:hypothetical protein